MYIAHTPTKVGGPADDVPGLHILMDMPINSRLDGVTVVPGDGLGLSRSPRTEQHVAYMRCWDDYRLVIQYRIAVSRWENGVHTTIRGSQVYRWVTGMIIQRNNDDIDWSGGHHTGIQWEHFIPSSNHILCEYDSSIRKSHTSGDLDFREGISNRDYCTTCFDDADIGRHSLGRHGHANTHCLPRGESIVRL